MMKQTTELLALLEKTESMINRSVCALEKYGVEDWIELLIKLQAMIEEVKKWKKEENDETK